MFKVRYGQRVNPGCAQAELEFQAVITTKSLDSRGSVLVYLRRSMSSSKAALRLLPDPGLFDDGESVSFSFSPSRRIFSLDESRAAWSELDCKFAGVSLAEGRNNLAARIMNPATAEVPIFEVN